jgi:hypothetical protein
MAQFTASCAGSQERTVPERILQERLLVPLAVESSQEHLIAQSQAE